MSTNDWKNKRFVEVEPGAFNIKGKHLIIMTELAYWAANVDDVTAWCQKHNCDIVGMTIEIPDDETYTLFCLRWS